MQMKHNSAIKQLLREFNTKTASKETEIDSAVKEAIGEDAQLQCDTADWEIKYELVSFSTQQRPRWWRQSSSISTVMKSVS